MRNRMRLMVVAGVLGATCATSSAAFASTQEEPEVPTSHEGVASSATYGYATFKPYGEHLYACDTREDGRSVKAEIRWGNKSESVVDTNGAKAGCGHKDLSIKEGTSVQFRVVVEGIGASPWVPDTA